MNTKLHTECHGISLVIASTQAQRTPSPGSVRHLATRSFVSHSSSYSFLATADQDPARNYLWFLMFRRDSHVSHFERLPKVDAKLVQSCLSIDSAKMYVGKPLIQVATERDRV